MKSTNRLLELDYLRGIAALSVVLFHYTFGYDNGLHEISTDKFYFKYGNYGVHLFFLISGYVIFKTLKKVETPLDFIVSRFSRLYPTYWAAILFSLVFVNIFSNPSGYQNVSFTQFFFNLSMVQHYFKIKDIDGAYWTLAIELEFYIIMFILFIRKQLDNIQKWSVIWLFISIIAFLFKFPLRNFLNQILILEHAPLFISGILFYELKKGKKVHTILLLVCCFITELYFSYSINFSLIPLFIIFCIYSCFLLISIGGFNTTTPIKPLLFFGDISYSLYLIHENVGITIIFNLKKRICDYQIFYIPITMLIVIFLAYILSNTIEKPAMAIIKQKYKTIKLKNI
jgi:peptidoglycan/LPS O-acetylase OafA/YrhL